MTISLERMIRSSVHKHSRRASQDAGAPSPLPSKASQVGGAVVRPVRRLRRRTIDASRRVIAPFATKVRHFLVGGLLLRFDALHARLERLEERITDKTGEVAVHARLERLAERIIDNTKELAEIQSVGNNVVQKLNGLLEAHSSIDAVHARLERLEERITDNTRGLAKAQSTANELVQKLDHLRSSVQVNHEARTRLHAQLERLEVRIGPNAREFAEAHNDIIQKLNLLLSRVHVDLDVDTSLIRSSIGYILVPKSDAALTALMVESGGEDYEVGTRKLIGKLAETSTRLIDVGANVGLLTLTMGRAMRQGGQVIALEPNPELARMLFRTVAINGMSQVVQIRQEAGSNKAGTVKLHLSDVCGHSSLLPFEASYPHAATQATAEVPSVRLDDIVPPGTPVDLVKIDVEGSELLVIAGMERIISENSDLAIIVEYGELHLRRANVSPHAWFTTFEDRGFSGYRIDEVSGNCEPIAAEHMSNSQVANLLFLRPQSRFTAQLGISRDDLRTSTRQQYE